MSSFPSFVVWKIQFFTLSTCETKSWVRLSSHNYFACDHRFSAFISSACLAGNFLQLPLLNYYFVARQVPCQKWCQFGFVINHVIKEKKCLAFISTTWSISHMEINGSDKIIYGHHTSKVHSRTIKMNKDLSFILVLLSTAMILLIHFVHHQWLPSLSFFCSKLCWRFFALSSLFVEIFCVNWISSNISTVRGISTLLCLKLGAYIIEAKSTQKLKISGNISTTSFCAYSLRIFPFEQNLPLVYTLWFYFDHKQHMTVKWLVLKIQQLAHVLHFRSLPILCFRSMLISSTKSSNVYNEF